MSTTKPTSLAEQAAVFIKQNIGGIDEAAAFFGVTKGVVKTWLSKKQFPQPVFEAMFSAATRPPDESEIITPEDLPQPGDQGVVAADLTLDEAEVVDEVVQEMSAVEARVFDLHQRVGAIEEQQIVDRLLWLESQMDLILGSQEAPRPDASRVRPPANAPRNPMAAAGIINPGGHVGGPAQAPRQVGIGSGRAPSRAEAHGSAQGTRGRPAGPATQRTEVRPGDPGWNGRDVDAKGRVIRPGWNDARPKMQTLQVPQGVWPMSPR